jgi:aspartyl aminopeptidase
MKIKQFNDGLRYFIDSSPTPFHVVQEMASLLSENGYQQRYEYEQWEGHVGKYFVTRNDSSIIAISMPGQNDKLAGFSMVGAHTDSPCLKVKPNPVIEKHDYWQLGVEVYGGALLNPWFDRDLSLAGRVSYLDMKGKIQSVLIDFKRPIAVIPSLAIHLDREANKKRSVNEQSDIVPVLMRGGGDSLADFNMLLTDQIKSEHQGISIDKVLDYELSFYDSQSAAITGFNNEFISSARLDNLLSCYVGLRSLIDVGSDVPSLLVCNDHEEVGSASSSGAQGPFLKSVLDRIAGSMEDLTCMVDRSMMISCDNAHAIHPNFSDKHDGNHGPALNQGPVIKTNANQRYASNSETSARFRQLCEQAEVPVQNFVTRTDMACGSTIGPITATGIGVKTVDVGVPQFAMHSIRETCGSRDPYHLYHVLREFYSSGP